MFGHLLALLRPLYCCSITYHLHAVVETLLLRETFFGTSLLYFGVLVDKNTEVLDPRVLRKKPMKLKSLCVRTCVTCGTKKFHSTQKYLWERTWINTRQNLFTLLLAPTLLVLLFSSLHFIFYHTIWFIFYWRIKIGIWNWNLEFQIIIGNPQKLNHAHYLIEPATSLKSPECKYWTSC